MVHIREIPDRTRWMMTTHVLTRLVVALGKEPAETAGIASYREILFSEMGQEIRAITDRYGMPREHAADLVQTLGAVSVILFGPAFETRYIEGFPEEAVIRLTECAMFRSATAGDVPPPAVHAICTDYLRHAIQALNPAFSIQVSQARCRGDAFCEMVIARRGD